MKQAGDYVEEALKFLNENGVELGDPFPDDAQCKVTYDDAGASVIGGHHVYVPAKRGCGLFKWSHPVARAMLIQRGMVTNGRCKCEPNPAEQQRVVASLRTNANLPVQRDRRERTFGNFLLKDGAEQASQAAQEWAGDEGTPILVLSGTTGSGKTHLIEAALRAVIERGKTARYEFAPELLYNLRNTFDSDADQTTAQVMGMAQKAEYLGLDDIGSEKPSDWVAEQFSILIDGKLRTGGRLIVATNNVGTEVRRRLGERIYSRLFDRSSGAVRVVALTCGDFRMQRTNNGPTD